MELFVLMFLLILVVVLVVVTSMKSPRAPSQYKDRLSSYGIHMLEIRRSRNPLIFNMGIPILVRQRLYIEMAPSCLTSRHVDWTYAKIDTRHFSTGSQWTRLMDDVQNMLARNEGDMPNKFFDAKL